jgi:hypothetical protein
MVILSSYKAPLLSTSSYWLLLGVIAFVVVSLKKTANSGLIATLTVELF